MLEGFFVMVFIGVLAWVLGRRSRLRLRMRVELLALLLATVVAGAYVVVRRFEAGLGAVTNLSDTFPWGIWIAFDLLCGVALAAGGFVLAAAVHVFHLRRFEPILRPAVLSSFLSYLLVAAALVLDLGRPYRFWHPLIMWQPHSVLFETTLCITFYSLVLAVEFSPALLEKLRWRGVAAAVKHITLPVVMTGVILSTLHQSSFGSIFLIIPQKLHALWYTPALPIFFLISSVCAGMAAIIVESHLCAACLGEHLPWKLMVDLGRACSRVLWVYLFMRVVDLTWRGVWIEIAARPWLGGSLALELVGGALVPALGFALIARDCRRKGLVLCALLVVGGVVLNRLNVCWFGLMPATGLIYWPSWMEWVLTLSLLLLGVMAFVAAARFLPVFPKEELPLEAPNPERIVL